MGGGAFSVVEIYDGSNGVGTPILLLRKVTDKINMIENSFKVPKQKFYFYEL